MINDQNLTLFYSNIFKNLTSYLVLCYNIGIKKSTSVRGTGAVSNRRVTSYQYLGCDAVGIPSTGLKAKPIRIDQTLLSGSQNNTVNENLQELIKKTNHTELKESNNMSNQATPLSEIQTLIAESINKVRKAKSKTNISSAISLTENKLDSIKLIDCSSASFGSISALEVFKEWLDLKEEVENSESEKDGKVEAIEPIKEETQVKVESCSTESKEDSKVDEMKEELEEVKESLENSIKTIEVLSEELTSSHKMLESLRQNQEKLLESAQLKGKEKTALAVKYNVIKSMLESSERNLVPLRESLTEKDSLLSESSQKIEKLLKENDELLVISSATKMAAMDLATRLPNLQ